MKNRHAGDPRRLNAIAAAVAACFSSTLAIANPTGPTVANGQVTFHQQGNLLQITNSPNAIINWQSFSIGANEITRFLQQSASSAVLNRVITQDPSTILGVLQSNGRVFLINPNGILFGPGSRVDVAGLLASTLNLSDQDFLAGRLRFTEVPGAGSVINQGAINTASGGQVYLVGPAVKNEGVITSPKGEVILAAGSSVELVNPGTPDLRVEITAPDNEAVNLGQIAADAGRVGIYAGLITQSGTVQANTAQLTEDGRIILRATKDVTLEQGSSTTANGPAGGNIVVQAADTTLVSGAVEAKGSEGKGGSVQLLGDRVGMIDSGSVDVSGETGGGAALVGGDFQGKNVAIQNASRTYVGPATTIAANANATGDGGTIIVWSDEVTRASGSMSAKGGAQSGNGGFVEVSGKRSLEFNSRVDTTAPRGATGSLLLDPTTISIAPFVPTTGGTCPLAGPCFVLAGNPDTATLAVGDMTAALGTTNVTVSTSSTGNGLGDIFVGAPVFYSSPNTLSLDADRNIWVLPATGIFNAGSGAISLAARENINIEDSRIVSLGGPITASAKNLNVTALIGFAGLDSPQITVNVNEGLRLHSGVIGSLTTVQSNVSSSNMQTINAGFVEVIAHGNNSANIVVTSGDQTITTSGSNAGEGILVRSADDVNAMARISQSGVGEQAISVTNGGRFTVNGIAGTAMVAGSTQNISASGGLIVHASGPGDTLVSATGGQAIDARYVEVRAENGGNASIANFDSGNQIITTHGANTQGEGIAVRSQGGFALIDQQASGLQSINVNNADYMRVIGESGSAWISTIPGANQSLTLQGASTNALEVGSASAAGDSFVASDSQIITAGLSGQQGSISVHGGGSGSGASARILGRRGQNIAAADISVTGGTGGTGNFADILQTGNGFNQNVTVRDGGTLSLQGGGGEGNFARIRTNFGNQEINVEGGAIVVTGGNGTSDNFAELRANNGNQTITGWPDITMTGGTGGMPDAGNRVLIRSATGVQTVFAGDTTITAGPSGFSNNANLSAPIQAITVDGDLVMTGGGSVSGAAQGGSARIGAPGGTPPGATDLVLRVTGDVTMTGGSLASSSIGSSTLGGSARSDITMFVDGNLTLNPGDGGGARIGSGASFVDGGNIFVNAGQSIILNGAPGANVGIRTTDTVLLQANSMTQAPEAQIVAGTLTTNTFNGSSLGGNNQVSNFNASNVSSGDVLLNNTSPLLTVTGINQTPFGALTLTQDGNLTLTGSIFSGPQSISATGDILVVPSSPAFVHALGPQVINAGGGLMVRSSLAGSAQVSSDVGQTIDATFVEVTARGNDASIINFGSGSQAITTSGTNGVGEGLAVRNFGGPGTYARISQVGTGEQTINVRNADQVSVNGIDGFALIGADLQAISVTGAASANAIDLGSHGALGSSQIFGGTQTITAGLTGQAGSITIYGSDAPNEQAIIVSGQGAGSQTVSTSGTLTVRGGSSPFGGFASGIFANGTGGQDIKAHGIVLQGGSSGAGNSAVIRNNVGDQHISAPGGAIVVAGGSSTGGLPQAGNNFARIENRSLSGAQTVESDTITITGGPNGESNFAGIQAAHQLITTTGDVMLVGGGGSVTGARIGAVGSTSPTDLKLNVGGKLTLTGGTETDASLGANRDGGQKTDVTVTVAGDITLNPGTNPGANARIGSPADNVASGNISLTSTGGNIALNSVPGIVTSIRTRGNVTLQANAIMQGDESTIQADRLTTVSNAGTSLSGKNQVAVFDATNGAIGGVLLHNASPSLTVTGVSTIPGPFTLRQDGDLAIIGDVWSGPQTINVSGDMTVGSDSNSVILYAAGPRTGKSVGEPHASWKALGVGLLDRLAGHSPINISARSLSVRGGSEFGSFAAITGGPINIKTTGDRYNGDFNLSGGSGFGSFGWVLSSQDVNLDIGGKLKLDSGTGFLSFARIQTVRPTAKIEIYFPNLSSGGYYVNGVKGTIRNGLSGFYTGPHAAKPGKGLLTDYGL